MPKRPALFVRQSAALLCAGLTGLSAIQPSPVRADDAPPESDGEIILDFFLSSVKDAAKSQGKKMLSKAGTAMMETALSYYGLDGLLGGESDPFAKHAAELLNAIETAKEEVIDHIDDRWDAQTYADASAAIKKLNQWRVLTLTERADQLSVAADLFDAFAGVLGRYEADLYQQRRFDLLHEYVAVADVTAALAVEWIELSVLHSGTKDIRTALTAEWREEGITRAATIQDALFAMDTNERAQLDQRLRQARLDSVDAILLGTGSAGIPAAANLIDAVGSIHAEDLYDVVGEWFTPIRVHGAETQSDGRMLSEWRYDLTLDGPAKTYSLWELTTPGGCRNDQLHYFAQWDDRETDWMTTWMSPRCGRADTAVGFPWGLASTAHKTALVVQLYAPVRLLLEKWWLLSGHTGARPYNELDDLTDMYFLDLHPVRGGDTIEEFVRTAPDGAPLRVDRTYNHPDWVPSAIWRRMWSPTEKRLPAGKRETMRALVDIALRHGADGAVDFLQAVPELDGLRSEAVTVAEVVKAARTGISPEDYRDQQAGAFAAKFVALF